MKFLVSLLFIPFAVYAECEVNFSCEQNPQISLQGSSTLALDVSGRSCSGTLMRNTNDDGRLLVLTAAHCFGDLNPIKAAETIKVAWNSVANCGDELGNAFEDATVTSGAIHRAIYSDMWLIELTEEPPAGTQMWFSGFNIGSELGRTHSIHHGNNLKKQILYSDYAYRETGISVIVKEGGASKGSSGAGLFDENGNLLGTLSKGSECSAGNQQLSYVSLSEAWEGLGTNETSMRPWLDPGSEPNIQQAGSLSFTFLMFCFIIRLRHKLGVLL